MDINTLPPAPTPSQLVTRYVDCGRTMAELVHADASIEYYYFAANILQSLNVPWNPTLPKSPNQVFFSTNGSGNGVQHALAAVCELSLKHAWFWKWCVFRKVRPECVGLWVDNVMNGLVDNSVYNIDAFLFANPVLQAVQQSNADFGFAQSFTLSQCYREGCPPHPSVPSAHSVVAGACAAILKCFFDGSVKWFNVPGLQQSTLNTKVFPLPPTGDSSFIPVVEATPDGSTLQYYANNANDASLMTVGDEINKLAFNMMMARDFAGVHYRSDFEFGCKVGEDLAINYMGDLLSSWVMNNANGSVPQVQFTKFDGTVATITPTVYLVRFAPEPIHEPLHVGKHTGNHVKPNLW